MNPELIELNNNEQPHQMLREEFFLLILNKNINTFEIYLKIKSFHHFSSSSTFKTYHKEILKIIKKIKIHQETLLKTFQNFLKFVPLIKKDEIITDILRFGNINKFNKNFSNERKFFIMDDLENLENEFEDYDDLKRKKIYLFKIWKEKFNLLNTGLLDKIFFDFLKSDFILEDFLTKKKCIYEILLKKLLNLIGKICFENLQFEIKKLKKMLVNLKSIRKKTSVLNVLLDFFLKMDDQIHLKKKPYMNILILSFMLLLNIFQILPYYSFSNNIDSFIDFLKYDEYNFFINLGINIFFFYLSLCYLEIIKKAGKIKRIFSYKKLGITCLIYYGMNIKRNSMIGNWNKKSNLVDFNLEIILIYFFSVIYLFFLKNEDYLKRFHSIKNRNKILKHHTNVMKHLQDKFLPISINTFFNICLLLFFRKICKDFQVNTGEIFMPFIILLLQNFSLFFYFLIVLIFRNNNSLRQVKVFEITYLLTKIYLFFVYIGVFIYKIYIVINEAGSFRFEESLFVIVISALTIKTFNEFVKKYNSFQRNTKFNVVKFDEPKYDLICWDEINEGIITECGHHFHSDCLFTWFEECEWNVLTCPTCRREL